MTAALHRAKEPEFDHVLLAGLEEGGWPSWQAEKHDAMPEERRLFYVGITRARHSLRLSWVCCRRDWDGKPSHFLEEIPRGLIEGAGSTSAGGSRNISVTAKMQQSPPTQEETAKLVAAFMAQRAARVVS